MSRLDAWLLARGRGEAHGTKRIRHPVGELAVCYDVLAVQDGSDQRLLTITPADAQSERVLRSIVAQGAGLRVVAAR